MATQPLPPRLELAEQIKDKVKVAIAAADDDLLADVTVTLDPLIVPAAAPKGVVVVSPPALTFETYTQFGATWTLEIVCGPVQDVYAAWSRADRIIQAIAQHSDLPLTGAQPGQYSPPGASEVYLAGYLLTIDDDYMITED